MSWRDPPYRIATLEEARGYAGRLGREEGRRLVRCARESRLAVPPALHRLPDAVAVPSYTLHALRRGQGDAANAVEIPATTRGALVRAALTAPPSYLDALQRVVEAGGRFLPERRGRGAGGGVPPGRSGPALRMLALQEDAPRVLGAALRVYLNTRDPQAREFLRHALLLLLLYARPGGAARGVRTRDRALVEACAELDLNGAGLPGELVDVFRNHLGDVRGEIFRPFYLQFLRRFRQRLHRVAGLPPNLKSNVFVAMRRVVDGTLTAARARVQFERLLAVHRAGLPERAVAGFRSVLDNYLEKVAEADGLFDELFGAGAGASAACGDPQGPPWGGDLVIERRLDDPECLTCYPTKDYLDLLKGTVSGDCTAADGLAERHLLHPRFFNVRIFRRTAWVGNAYALDFTDRGPPTVVLDRIQLQDHGRQLSTPVFEELVGALARTLSGDGAFRVLAPGQEISNSSRVRSRFQGAVAGRPRVAFAMGGGEAAFESARQASFVVLAEPRGAVPP